MSYIIAPLRFNLNIATGYYKAIMNGRVNDSFWDFVLKQIMDYVNMEGNK